MLICFRCVSECVLICFRCISACVLICFRMLCLVYLREMPYSDSTRFPSGVFQRVCWSVSGVFQRVCVDLFQVCFRVCVDLFQVYFSVCVDLFQDAVPGVSARDAVQRLYPFSIMLGKEGRTAVEDTLQVCSARLLLSLSPLSFFSGRIYLI